MNPELAHSATRAGPTRSWPAAPPAPPLAVRVLASEPCRAGAVPLVVDDEPMPTVVYFHGGGWVVGDRRHPPRPRPSHLHARCDAVVVSVDYRLSARGPVPGGLRGRLARAAEWAYQNASVCWSSASNDFARSSPETARAASSRRRWPSGAATPAGRSPRSCCSTRSPTSQGAMTAEPCQRLLHVTRVERTQGELRTDPSRAWPISPRSLRLRRGIGRLAGVAQTAGGRPERPGTRPLCTRRRWTSCGPRATSTPTRCAGPACDVISREWPTLNHSYFGLGGVSAVADGAAATGAAATDLHEILRRNAPAAAGPRRPAERPLPLYP